MPEVTSAKFTPFHETISRLIRSNEKDIDLRIPEMSIYGLLVCFQSLRSEMPKEAASRIVTEFAHIPNLVRRFGVLGYPVADEIQRILDELKNR